MFIYFVFNHCFLRLFSRFFTKLFHPTKSYVMKFSIPTQKRSTISKCLQGTIFFMPITKILTEHLSSFTLSSNLPKNYLQSLFFLFRVSFPVFKSQKLASNSYFLESYFTNTKSTQKLIGECSFEPTVIGVPKQYLLGLFLHNLKIYFMCSTLETLK